MRRLSRRLLPELPRSARRPQYDRDKLTIGMAHIGVGAFHRCHQAEFVDDMLEAQFGPWGVLGVNLKAPRLTDLLAPQDCLYSRTLKQDARAETRIIGALRQAIDIEDEASAEAAAAALAGPSIRVATITVTEKGYCLTPATGALDLENPELKADLEGAWPPRTLVGLLALALERRRTSGGAGLTLISCDNVPSNGARLSAAVMEFAGRRSAALARWIEDNVTFPCSMVDRIVPATTPEDIEAASRALRSARPRCGRRRAVPPMGHRGQVRRRATAARPGRRRVRARTRGLTSRSRCAFSTPRNRRSRIKARSSASSSAMRPPPIRCFPRSPAGCSSARLPPLCRRSRRWRPRPTSISRWRASATPPFATAAIRSARTDRRRSFSVSSIRCASASPPGGRADLLTLSVASWIAYCLSGSRRFGARWTPSDPYAETIIAMGDRISDFVELAKSVLAIARDLPCGHGASATH